MSRSILTTFHKYTPFGDEFYEPILDFFYRNFDQWNGEVDKIYLLDSTWNIDHPFPKTRKVNSKPHLRYYDAYKDFLPFVSEDLVLFMDNDMIVYKKHIFDETFKKLEQGYDVVSIYDTIGTYQTDKLNGKNKMCPYWFATKRETLLKYIDVDWSPDHMPYTETFGMLTEAMLNDGLKPYEIEEDKTSMYFDGSLGYGTFPKDLGYYHIRSGSLPAYLLAVRKYGNKNTYKDYITNQPKNEYLRQFAWYHCMCTLTGNQKCIKEIESFLKDVSIDEKEWAMYVEKFAMFHGLWKKIS